MLKKIFLKLSAPLRWMIRHELWTMELTMNRSIDLARKRQATLEAAQYVEAHLAHTDSFGTPEEVLSEALRHVKNSDGLFLEFGVFSGRTINHVARQIGTTIYGFDSFEGLPERWRDGLGPGFFKVDKLPEVRKNVVLIKGWFNQTLPGFVKEHPQPVAFLHVDCDLYSSTRTIFEALGAQIVDGTVIVFDEYFNYPGWRDGEYKAFQEFIQQRQLAYEYLGYNRNEQQVAVKVIRK